MGSNVINEKPMSNTTLLDAMLLSLPNPIESGISQAINSSQRDGSVALVGICIENIDLRINELVSFLFEQVRHRYFTDNICTCSKPSKVLRTSFKMEPGIHIDSG